MGSRLLIRPGAIGDFVVSLPAMQSLRADEIWCTGVNVPLGRTVATRARSIVSTGLDRLGIVEADDVVERLRGFDSIVSWYGTNRPDFRDLVGALGLPFTFHVSLPSGGGHATDFYSAQVGMAPGAVPRIEVPACERQGVVVQPFSGSAKKNWPMARFEELAKRVPVIWCRGPEDELKGAVCIPDLYELACWLGSARVFVGNDSGVTHLAAAVGTKTVALFQASDPGVWAPRGRVRVLVDATVEEVVEAVGLQK